MQFRYVPLFLLCLVEVLLVDGAIDLPDQLINTVGESVSFKIPSDLEPELFGANYLPVGLTLDSETGTVSGVPREVGTWSTLLFILSGGDYETKELSWRISESDDTPLLDSPYSILRGETHLEIGTFHVGLENAETVEILSVLPAGIFYDDELSTLNGTPTESGLFEIAFKYQNGPFESFLRVLISISDSESYHKFELSGSPSSAIAYFKGKYFHPTSFFNVSVSTDLENWEEVTLFPGRNVQGFATFKGLLFANCNGGYLLSEDGETFEFFASPNNSTASHIYVGKNGVIAEFQDVNNGSLYYSSDCKNWEEWNYPMSRVSKPIVVEDMFYFYDDGTFYVTRQGVEWWTVERQSSPIGIRFDQTFYINGTFVANGTKDNEIYLSEDAAWWTVHEINLGVEFNQLKLVGGRLFLWGEDEDNSEPDTILSSQDGVKWEPVNIGHPVWRTTDLHFENDQLLAQQTWINGRGASYVAGPILDTPGFLIPEFMEFFVGEYFYYPLNITGSFDTLRAYGLPQGIQLDYRNGAIFGVPEVGGHPSKEVLFVGEHNGQPGLFEDAKIISWEGREARPPTVTAPCVIGQVGWRLTNQGFSFSPEDHTSTVTLVDAPDWMSIDHNDFDGVPTEVVETSFMLEVSNLYGSTTVEVPLLIGQPVLQHSDLGILSSDLRYFAHGKNRYFARSNFASYWSDDLVNWNSTHPAMEGPGKIIEFKDRLYFVEAPRLYRSIDGSAWTPLDIPALYNPRTDSVFATDDRLYVISDDKLVCSEDGLNWEIVESDRPSHFSVTWQGEHFFAFDRGDDRILQSSDAITWNVVFDEQNDFLDIYGIVYGGGVYLAWVDDFENKYPLLRSSDGLTWERLELPEEQQIDPIALVFANGKFHLAGNNDQHMTSTDGLVWNLYDYSDLFNSPQIEDFIWDGTQLWAVSSSSGIYKLGSDLPPAVKPIYDATYELGKPVDQDLDITGTFDRLEVVGLPSGLSLDQAFKRIVGTPTETGPFRACIFAISGDAISRGEEYYGLVVDSTQQPHFREDFIVSMGSDLNVVVADFGAEYQGFELSSTNLPNELAIHGYQVDGDVSPGSYPVDFKLSSFDGSVELEKQIPFYISTFLHSPVWEQSLQMRGKQGVPLSESILLSTFVDVGGVTGLPSGVTYDPATSMISGTPTRAGEYLITVDLEGQGLDFYYKLTVSEDLNFLRPAQGAFDNNGESLIYVVQLGDELGYGFRWFHNGFPITADSTVSGELTSRLTVSDLRGRDPQVFSIEISRDGRRVLLDVPFRRTRDEYQSWANTKGLLGNDADPLARGGEGRIQNVFAFAQQHTGLSEVLLPEIVMTHNGYGFQFVTDLFWSQVDLRVLVTTDLRGGWSEVIPVIVEETNSYRKWSASVASPDLDRWFVSVRGHFFEND